MQVTVDLVSLSAALSTVRKGAIIPTPAGKPRKMKDGTTAPLEWRRVCIEVIKGTKKHEPFVRLTTFNGADLTEELLSVLDGTVKPGACWVNVDTLNEWVKLGRRGTAVTFELNGDALTVRNGRCVSTLRGGNVSDIPENAYDEPEKQAA